MLTYPPNPKTKSVYFIKKREEAVTAENMKSLLIFGDMAPNPVEELSVLMEEVLLNDEITEELELRELVYYSCLCRLYLIPTIKEDGPDASQRIL